MVWNLSESQQISANFTIFFNKLLKSGLSLLDSPFLTLPALTLPALAGERERSVSPERLGESGSDSQDGRIRAGSFHPGWENQGGEPGLEESGLGESGREGQDQKINEVE